MHALVPESWLRNPDFAAYSINLFGIVTGSLDIFFCTLYFRSLYGLNVAVATSLLFFLSPVMLPVAFSGHPIVGASACLFLSGGLFTLTEPNAERHMSDWVVLPIILILLIIGLSLRAEIILAFPFVWLALEKQQNYKKSSWLYFFLRGALFAIAFVIFLVFQQGYLDSTESPADALASFINQFLSISKISRGFIVFALSLGAALILISLIAASRGARVKRREIYLLLVLAIPSLIMFLPNPQPARHLFFPALAFCLFAGLLIQSWLGLANVIGFALLTVLLNQGLIELMQPLITSRSNYVKNYPSLTERRFSPAAPSGAFLPDQIAIQVNENAEREEARLVAEHAPNNLIILADHAFYLIAHLIAANPSLHNEYGEFNGIRFVQLKSDSKSYFLMERYSVWPKDITPQILNHAPWQNWPVYEQPSTKSRYYKTEIPSQRRFILPGLKSTIIFYPYLTELT